MKLIDKNGKVQLKTEEKSGKFSLFVRFLGKYNFRDEKQFKAFSKWLTFIVLVVLETLIVLEHLNNFIERGGIEIFLSIFGLVTILTGSQALRLFVFKDRGHVVFFALEAFSAALFVFVTMGLYPILVYIVVLTGFYISTERTKTSVIMYISGIVVYGICYALQVSLDIGGVMSPSHWLPIFTESFGSAVILSVHYLVVQLALAFYRQFLKLDKALKELDESQKQLKIAYEAVAEVTALEERQRIAKDIHDTAGHSLTTVIMQTEAAKLILDKDPQQAKQKIVAANLQAKNALEELRNSVHLLSGNSDNQTLKSILEDIIHDSTDGTGINIRSSIEELKTSPAKARFLCNTLKEGISNGLRHGNATAFWFELKEENGKICFLLSDNGKGVQSPELKLGFGLRTMRDRVKSLGGEIIFRAEEEEGFEISITLPVDNGAER